jgi:phosphate:Na+ symporter
MLLLFPFVGAFERVLSRVGHTSAEDREDYSIPRYLNQAAAAEFSTGVARLQQELARHVEATSVFVEIARGTPGVPKIKDHNAAVEILGRDIRSYAAAMFRHATTPAQAERLASLIEEADLTVNLGETLHQAARDAQARPLSADARSLVVDTLDRVQAALAVLVAPGPAVAPLRAEQQAEFLLRTREKCLALPLAWEERGAILEVLGSVKRAFYLIDLVRAERDSVARGLPEPGQPGPL